MGRDGAVGQYKRRIMADEDARRKAASLGELVQANIDVFCWCNRCGHNSVVAAGRLAAELGHAFTVPDVGSRMRCSGCGTKDVAARPNWPSLGTVTRHD